MGCDKADHNNNPVAGEANQVPTLRPEGKPMSVSPAIVCVYEFTEGAADPTPLTAALASRLTCNLRCFETLGDLFAYLKSPATADDIIVLAPQHASDMTSLLAHNRLQDRRLVLVLPDDEESTLSQAHLLAPRYLCFADDMEAELVAVLDKMATTPRLQASTQNQGTM